SLNRTMIEREGRRRLWGVPRNAITKTDIQRLDQRIIGGLNTINFRATTEQFPVTFSDPLLHLPIYPSLRESASTLPQYSVGGLASYSSSRRSNEDTGVGSAGIEGNNALHASTSSSGRRSGTPAEQRRQALN